MMRAKAKEMRTAPAEKSEAAQRINGGKTMRKLFATVAASLGLAALIAATSPAGSALIAGITATLVD
jgi:hypothetical protein